MASGWALRSHSESSTLMAEPSAPTTTPAAGRHSLSPCPEAPLDQDRERLAATRRLKIRIAWGLLAGSATNAAAFLVTGSTSLLVVALLLAGLAALNFRSGESR